MARQFFIGIIVILGFFLTPTLTYACGKSVEKTEKSCCKKETSKSDKKDCCKNHSQKDKNDDDCDGKCKNSSCHCPTAPLAIVLPFVTEMKYYNIFLEKVTIAYTEIYISSGFHSIWLPPKIS